MLFPFLILTGCTNKAPECKQPGCKYVFERKVESNIPPAPERVDYVMLLISATSRNDSHCAALFCKVKNDKAIESTAISWMPATRRTATGFRAGNVVEDGVNLDIASTMAWAKSKNCTIERHGPYYIKEELYTRAKKQEQKLCQGSVKFKSADTPQSRQANAVNNIHAISDMLCNGDQFDKYLVTGRSRGRDASAILKVYFDKRGYIEGKYNNEAELLREFDLTAVRRLD
jgi:hypothetical protein